MAVPRMVGRATLLLPPRPRALGLRAPRKHESVKIASRVYWTLAYSSRSSRDFIARGELILHSPRGVAAKIQQQLNRSSKSILFPLKVPFSLRVEIKFKLEKGEIRKIIGSPLASRAISRKQKFHISSNKT